MTTRGVLVDEPDTKLAGIGIDQEFDFRKAHTSRGPFARKGLTNAITMAMIINTATLTVVGIRYARTLIQIENRPPRRNHIPRLALAALSRERMGNSSRIPDPWPAFRPSCVARETPLRGKPEDGL